MVSACYGKNFGPKGFGYGTAMVHTQWTGARACGCSSWWQLQSGNAPPLLAAYGFAVVHIQGTGRATNILFWPVTALFADGNIPLHLAGQRSRSTKQCTPFHFLVGSRNSPEKPSYSILRSFSDRGHTLQNDVLLFATLQGEKTLPWNHPLCSRGDRNHATAKKCSTLLPFINSYVTVAMPHSAVFQQQKSCTRNSLLCCLLATEIWHHKQSTLLSFSNRNTPLSFSNRNLTRKHSTLWTFSNRNFTPHCCLSATEISHQKCSALLSFSNRNFTPETLCSFVFQQQKFHTRNAPFCFLSSKEILLETLKCLSGPEVSPRTLQACLSGTDKTLIGHKPYTQLYYLEDRIYTSWGGDQQAKLYIAKQKMHAKKRD